MVPLMAINYARAAQTDFANMKLAELRYEHAPPAERAGIAAEITDIASTFSDDLDVAVQRSHADDEVRTVRQIRPLVAQWRAARARGDIAELERLDGKIDEKFDLLVEFHTDHSYRRPPPDGDNITTFKYAMHGHDGAGAAAGRRHHLAAAQPYRAPAARRRRRRRPHRQGRNADAHSRAAARTKPARC